MCKKLITTDGNKLIDCKGRHTILHGINMVCKEKEKGYIGAYHEEDFQTLKQWGFNVIRLGIFWDGVEPSPGQYDDNYLAEIDRIIGLAGKYELYVLLDMHQDLFSCIFSDGAPEWATLTDGQEHIRTELWSEAYLISPAVQTAFDNFWNNRPASDGIGIQDHYISMWKHIATRYRDNQSVIGYDILNEPFMGTSVNQLLTALLATMGQMIYQDEPFDMERLMEQWLDPVQKMELMSVLSDKDIYTKLMREVEEIPRRFETTYLQEFYDKAARAIREADEETMILLEANYFSNTGMRSGIRPAVDTTGTQIKYQVYSPHGYDLLVDTAMYHQSGNERVDVIFETHKSVQEELQIPMLVGEWGCFPDASEDQLPQAFYLSNLYEKYLSGDTYFDFSHIYNNRITQAIIRAYPMKVAGDIISYYNNYADGSFQCIISEHGIADLSIVYVPDISLLEDVTLEPYEQGYRIERIEGGDSGYLIIPASGHTVSRKLSFRRKEDL